MLSNNKTSIHRRKSSKQLSRIDSTKKEWTEKKNAGGGNEFSNVWNGQDRIAKAGMKRPVNNGALKWLKSCETIRAAPRNWQMPSKF